MPPPGYAPPGGRIPPPPRAERRPGPPQDGGGGGGLLKFVGFALLTIVVLAVAGALAIYVAGPADLVRDQIVSRVKKETGRDLVINGATSFTIYPSLGVSMGDIALSAPPGMAAPPLVTAKSLTASVALMPLLSRNVEVQQVLLQEPVVNLVTDKSGRQSWDFAFALTPDAARVRYAQATPAGVATDAVTAPAQAPAPATETPAFSLEQLALEDVRIEQGTLNYTDERTGAAETVSAINMKLGLPAITSTATLVGDLVWRSEKLDIDAKLTSPKQLIEKAPVQLVATINGRPVEARYDGSLKLGDAVETDGDLALSGKSLKALLAFAGNKTAASPANDSFTIAGKLRAAANTYTLSGMNAALDKAKATGDLAVTTGGARPIVKANLKLAELDLNPYLDASAAPPTPASPAKAPPAKAPPAAKTDGGAQSIEDLLQREPAPPPGPRVQGFTQRIGLNPEPLDLTALDAADMDVTFDATRIAARGITIDRATGHLGLASRVLKLDLAELKALDGTAKGFLSIDGRAPLVVVGTDLAAEGFSLLPLARLAGLDAVSGSGRIGARIAMAGQGRSEREVADTLAGQSQVSLTGGNLSYQSAGARHDLKGIDLALGITSLSGPLTAKGGTQWNGERVAVDATLSTLKELADARPVAVKVAVAGKPVTVNYDGTIAYAEKPAANGQLSLKTPSARTLAAWLGTNLPEGPGFGPLDLTSKVALQQDQYVFKGTRLTLDGDTATGDISIATAGARPSVKADLKLTGLDLNKYIADLSAPKKPAATKKVTEVRGYTQRGGWSDEPYDLGALGLVDLDARLSLGRLLYKKIKVGQSAVAVGLKNSVLKTDFTDVQLYSGRGKGMVAVDASNPNLPKIVTNLNVTGIEALPLLKDAADLDWLAGKGNVALGVTGQGKSQRALMNALGGSADLKFNDGAIVGINIPGLLRNVGQGKLGGLSSAPTEKTDFSEMSSSWAINNGVARNSDLKLVGPLIRVTGEGAVKLGERTIDYTLKPKIVADARGQGGAIDIGGLEVPVKVQGSWEKPKFAPDVKGILKDPNKAIDAVKEIGKQFKGKDAKDILKGILGGGQ